MAIDEELEFEWDAAKAASNVAKHGVEDASYVFDDPMRLEESDRFSRDEYRGLCIGVVDGVLLTVVYAEPRELVIRIISARRATAHERKSYDASIFHP